MEKHVRNRGGGTLSIFSCQHKSSKRSAVEGAGETVWVSPRGWWRSLSLTPPDMRCSLEQVASSHEGRAAGLPRSPRAVWPGVESRVRPCLPSPGGASNHRTETVTEAHTGPSQNKAGTKEIWSLSPLYWSLTEWTDKHSVFIFQIF